FVGGDLLLALFARKEVRSGLVVPVDASMVLEDLLPKAKVWRTRVGDVYVAAELKRRGADFGGEPSGTWIFPKSTFCPDGVYAAGEGTRMRPLTANLPKRLLPVAGKPFLRHTLEALGAAGVREIAILIGWQGHRIRERFGDGKALGLSLEYEEQGERLGTAH